MTSVFLDCKYGETRSYLVSCEDEDNGNTCHKTALQYIQNYLKTPRKDGTEWCTGTAVEKARADILKCVEEQNKCARGEEECGENAVDCENVLLPVGCSVHDSDACNL